MVAWTGSGVFAVDIANLNTGLFAFSNYGGSQVGGQINGLLPITMIVVPEIDPNGMGSVLALVAGVLGLIERRRLKAA